MARSFSVARFASAVGALALVFMPGRARADNTYTLDFTGNAANNICISQNPCSENQNATGQLKQNYGSQSDANVTNGTLASFGTAGAPSFTSGNTGIFFFHQGCCGESGAAPFGIGYAHALGGGAGTVGVFVFTPTGTGQSITLNSLIFGSSNPSATNKGVIKIYDASTNALLYDSNNPYPGGIPVSGGQSFPTPATVNFGICSNNGLRLEWGTGNAGYESYSVDDISYTAGSSTCAPGTPSSVTPEPYSLALMATGLVGLAPLVRRRRRRQAAA